ncbi:MAG: hypothetical protein PHN69_08315 [Candidatus Pacebacteria bacterium]|nr:hypothetical protein [Candidatus Paceibacterota bacterium]
MARKGEKTITVSEEEHELIKEIAKELDVGQRDVVMYSIDKTFINSDQPRECDNPIIAGIDLNLLLEDLARLTKRVAELESDKDKLIRFIRGKFPKDSNRLTKLLNTESTNYKKPSSELSIFGQEDVGMTTEQAISEMFNATPAIVDPLSKMSPIFSEQKGQIPKID